MSDTRDPVPGAGDPERIGDALLPDQGDEVSVTAAGEHERRLREEPAEPDHVDSQLGTPGLEPDSME